MGLGKEALKVPSFRGSVGSLWNVDAEQWTSRRALSLYRAFLFPLFFHQ